MNGKTITRTARRSRRRTVASLLVAAVATSVLALTLGAAEPAGAAFPGANGKIAFAGYSAGDYNIWVMNADGSYRTYLTSSPDWEDQPAFSPDGSKIAYVRQEDVWVMNANGGAQTNLTQNRTTDDTPAWSPDGSKIAFETYRDGDWEIYVMNADGSGQTNLTRHAGPESEPAWS